MQRPAAAPPRQAPAQRASPRPQAAQLPVTSQLHCQPPARVATQATSGGPANWPSADHCCIQPTVVETVCSPGASRTASENSVPGTTPPTSGERAAPRQ